MIVAAARRRCDVRPDRPSSTRSRPHRTGRERPRSARRPPSSRSTAATRRRTSRCVGRGRAIAGRGARADDLAPGGRAGGRRWSGSSGSSRQLRRAGAGLGRRPAADIGVLHAGRRRHPGDVRRLDARRLRRAGLRRRDVVVNDAFAPVRAGSRAGLGRRRSSAARASTPPGSRRTGDAPARGVGDISGDWGGGGDRRDGRRSAPRSGRATAEAADDARGRWFPAISGLRRPLDVTQRDRVRTPDDDRLARTVAGRVRAPPVTATPSPARSSTGWPTSSRRWPARSSGGCL